MADIDRIFAAIHDAMSFAVQDPAFACEWDRLSKAADDIAEQFGSALPDFAPAHHPPKPKKRA